MRRSLLAFSMLALTAAAATAEDFPAERIHGFGSKANRINLVIIGDGWSRADIDSGAYKRACAALKDGLLKEEPLQTYANFLTITRVDVPSPRSGVTHEYVWMGEYSTGGASPSPSPSTSAPPATTGSVPATTDSTGWTRPATWNGLDIVAATPSTWVQPGTNKLYRAGPVMGSYYGTWYYASRNASGNVLSVDRSVYFRDGFTAADGRWICTNMLRKIDRTNRDLPRNIVACLINDSSPGGAALPGYFTLSNDPGSVKVMTHELGHALALLGDEYVEWGNERTTPILADSALPANLTTQPAPTLVKWKHWVGFEGIANPVEGGDLRSTGVWRPRDNCMMREHWAAPFCAVCKEEVVRRFFTHVSLIDTAQPEQEKLKLTSGASRSFKVTCVGPKENRIEGEWYLDGKLVEGTKSDTSQGPVFEVTLGADLLVPGAHEVRCVVTDRTPMVKDAREGEPEYRRRPNQHNWYVSVREPSGLPRLRPASRGR